LAEEPFQELEDPLTANGSREIANLEAPVSGPGVGLFRV